MRMWRVWQYVVGVLSWGRAPSREWPEPSEPPPSPRVIRILVILGVLSWGRAPSREWPEPFNYLNN